MNYLLEIEQEEEIEDIYTEEFSSLTNILSEIFEEWKGMGWVNKIGFMPQKGRYLICFHIEINDGYEQWHSLEIDNLDSLNQTINIIFNSFKSGYEKEYRIKEVRT